MTPERKAEIRALLNPAKPPKPKVVTSEGDVIRAQLLRSRLKTPMREAVMIGLSRCAARSSSPLTSQRGKSSNVGKLKIADEDVSLIRSALGIGDQSMTTNNDFGERVNE